MSELAAVVASAMGPGEVDDLLSDAMRVLRERYGAVKLRAVTLTFAWHERDDGRSEQSLDWSVQVDNEHGYGKSRAEALEKLHENLETNAAVPFYAERVAEVLREVTPRGRAREHVLQQVSCILESDRRRGR